MVSSRAGLTTVTAAAAAAFAMFTTPAHAATNPLTNQYQIINSNSLASAMMLGLINEDYVYILDKVEGNKARVPGTNKPVWGSVLSLSDNSVTAINVNTNTFCASGATLGNGSWVVAGGNSPVTYGGSAPATGVAVADTPYQDADGRKAIRILDPVASGTGNSSIVWSDAPGGNSMQSQRWYPGVESLPDGSMVLIGGATNGGYINRNFPNLDPGYEGTPGQGSISNIDGGANPTYEFWPSKGALKESAFMVNTSGLNMYAHMFLLPSGNIFMQANYSTAIWNYTANTEYYLPDMPDQTVRVYPASGATAMLPLTPDNNYTPTILFCGGTSVPADTWGDYTAPRFNPLTTSASDDCSSIVPENADGSVNTAAQYNQEEKLPEGRTMGQFIHLPNGKMVIVNGAEKGTAGYGNVSVNIPYSGYTPTWSNSFNTSTGTVYTEAFSQDPTYTPVLYDPTQPLGSRLSRAGFGASQIARLYHSSALLLPDGAVLVAGSNPHQDVSLGNPASVQGIQVFDTEYRLEKWYPEYYFEDRPQPQGLPSYLLYGGDTWSFSITNTTYLGKASNYLANATEIYVIRPGFSTHAMNMGQRSLKLKQSYTVNDDGTIDYTVMPMPSNVNLFAPGPALLFVTVNGVPSAGKYIMVGQQSSGGTIPHTYANDAKADPTLPASSNNSKFNAVPSGSGSSSGFGTGAIVGVAVGAAVLILLILLGLLCWRRSANKRANKKAGAAAAGGAAGGVYRQASYNDTGAGEYKRVNTPSSSVAGFPQRGPMATYDSYRMDNVSGPNTPYYDNPRDSQRSMTPGAHYEQQGWGEHHGGDAGDFYKENFDNAGRHSSARYYDQSHR